MKKQFMGKYASGNRKAAMQAKAERDFAKSLPLAIRKVMKQRDAALGMLNSMIPRDGSAIDRDAFIAQRRVYDTLRLQVDGMIKEYRNA